MDGKTGRISAIYVKRTKEGSREEISTGVFRERFGLEGDINSAEGPRQVCLLRKEDRERVEQDRREGLCFQRFKETVQTEGISLECFGKGSELQLGDSIMRVTVKGKKCWPECKIIQAGEVCSLAGTARFLEVLKTGIIKKGDSVSLEKSGGDPFV